MAEENEKDGREPVAVQEEKGTNNRRNNDTKVGLTLRIVVAAYVLYLAYGLIEGFGDVSGNDKILIGAAIAVFLVAGGAILIISAKKLIRKEYRDAEESAEGTESSESTQDEEKR